jgi:galactose mutarotase-like enzyme
MSRLTHRTDKRGDRSFDVLTDEAIGLRLIISRLGAELISVARRNPAGEWVGFLNRDNQIDPPEKGWANHATVMGYFLHRIKNERSLYRGKEIRGGTHSFLRGKVWHSVESDHDNELIYRITPEDFSPTEYPLRVSLDLTYRIEACAFSSRSNSRTTNLN